jgi:hypothetical protein
VTQGDRHRPAPRRECEVREFEFGSINYTGKISRDPETGATDISLIVKDR